ncbi:hypothetical protein AVEN_181123-1 [Araneus ventricosus]|uniref:Uncharacterized protein n=1 Tax=Araneus ventricosus TaxID=182803 RepID=A0A4Y2HL18_ARAVE|nr:hypothetical protein AVEN_181123-1 [Araneus ventricosus]
MAAKGIEMRVATGDADTYIVRCGLEKVISHSIVAITRQDVDLVVLLIDLTPPESNIYFMKPGKGKVETAERTFFCTYHPPSPCIQWLRRNTSYL